MFATPDIRRTALFGMALLVFLAVVGPACLFAASEAMGMPMGPPPVSSSDCGSDGSSSIMVCPHDNPVVVVADVGASTPKPLDVVFTTPTATTHLVLRARVAPHEESVSAPPVTHLTPLRL